jgi:hypothetical protein
MVPGDDQTDICAASSDKGTGLLALMQALGEWRLAAAIGDSRSDLPVLRMADRAWAPRNADAAVRASGTPITRRAYQEGLLQSCARLLGHRPGSCPTCRPPRPKPRQRAMLALLATSGTPGALPQRLATLAGHAARSRPWWRSPRSCAPLPSRSGRSCWPPIPQRW